LKSVYIMFAGIDDINTAISPNMVALIENQYIIIVSIQRVELSYRNRIMTHHNCDGEDSIRSSR
jgi:hypothetical protein